MTLQTNWSPEVLQALAHEAPAGGDVWLTAEELMHVVQGPQATGLGQTAINLRAAVRKGYAERRVRTEPGPRRPGNYEHGGVGQPEHRATAALLVNPQEAMWNSRRRLG